MAEKNNYYTIQGVMYSKATRTVDGKKGTKTEGQTFEFPSFILEVKRDFGGSTFTDLPEFELAKNVTIDGFDAGDNVEVNFALSGRKISWKKDGQERTIHKTTLKALYIRHTDIQSNDTKDVGTPPKPPKDNTFTPPNPYNGDDENPDDLPF